MSAAVSDTPKTRVAVIGGGLAAHAAAATLADAGAEALMIYPSSPGATALWGGLGQVYGPTSDFWPRSTGLIGKRQREQRRLRTDRGERFDALCQRRGFHPYRRLGLDRGQVEDHLRACVDALAYPGLSIVEPELVIASPAGAPYPADLAASSVLGSAVAAGERVGIATCAALLDWYPERLAAALAGALDTPAEIVSLGPLETIDGVGQHSVRVAAQLRAQLSRDSGALADAVAAAAAERDLDTLILPPCIGATWAEHRDIFAELSQSTPCRVAEAAAARNSVHGWRLDRYLRANCRLETVSSRASEAHVDQRSLRRVQTESGAVEADAFVLATGRWVGRGLPAQAPLREPLTGVDLWIDGAPVPNPDEVWPAGMLQEHVWEDHPLFRAGLATDAALRPLDRDGSPFCDNLFAAGRVLADANPIWDGTTAGVDLVTGRLAAESALDFLGLPAPTTEAAS